MDNNKNAKVYLPNNYEQYLLQKKKIMKSSTHSKVLPSEQLKDNKPNNLLSSQFFDNDPPGKKQNDPNKVNNFVVVEKVIFSEYKKMFDQFQNSKFQAMRSKINNQIEKLKEHPPIDIPSISEILNNMQIQSLQNINTIRQEFRHPPGKRSIEKLQKMLSFNKFFIILNKEKKWKIFDNCSFEQFQAGKKIYSQGDTDDHMYVIIKGCVKQYQQRLTSYNEKIIVNFTSHYEGSNFGEVQGYAENQTKGRRYHSIETTEKCYLLKILNSYYRDLISNSAEDDFQKKVNALMDSTIFRQTSKRMVTPLMSTLEKHILPYGKVLIKQGQQVKKLYFVGDGNLKVLFIDRVKRTLKHLNIEQKPENFSISRPKTNHKTRSKAKNYSIHSTFYYPETEDTSKQFIYGKKRIVGQQIQYNDQVIFCELRAGDFFGGKSFLSHIEKQKKEQSSQYFDSDLKAKLSVVSSSTQSLVYSIDEKKFFSLSQNLQKLIVRGIMDEAYFDQYNIDQKLNANRQWKKYSQKLVQNIIKAKKTKTHSFRE